MKERDPQRESLLAALRATLSGGAAGGILGAGSKFLQGAPLPGILRGAGMAAGIGAGIAGGSQLVGSAIMGPPEPDGKNSFMRRGALGGLAIGGGTGAILGALAAAGKLPQVSSLPRVLQKVLAEMPLDNAITRKLTEYAARPNATKVGKGALIGLAALGIPSAYLGGDEGIAQDIIEEEMDEEEDDD